MTEAETPHTRRRLGASSLPLSFWAKASYGVGSVGIGMMQGSFFLFLLLFYTDTIRLTPSLIGLALAVGRIWDAFSDPLMGQISDRTSSQFGRRRPFVMFGSLFWGLVYVLLWMASPAWSTWTKFSYLVIMDLLFSTALTIVSTPYMALGAELSTDYSERSEIVAYRLVFGHVGNTIGAGLLMYASFIGKCSGHLLGRYCEESAHVSRVLNTMATDDQASWIAAAAIMAVAATLFLLISGLCSRERFATRAARRFRTVEALKVACTNLNYLRVAGTHLVGWLAGQVGSFLLPFLLIYWVKRDEFIQPGIMTLAGISLVVLPAWIALGRRLEKSTCYRIALLIGILTGPASLLTFNPRFSWLFFLWVIWVGTGTAGGHTYCQSMIADVTDEDELSTGERREGMFFGILTFAQKFVGSLGLVWAGVALKLVGYVPGAEQSDGTLWGMRMLYAIPSLSGIAGLFLLRNYRLSRARLAEIQREVTARASGD